MKKRFSFGTIVILLLIFSGCWAPKSIMTTANITQPVLVGKVKTIGGGPVENSELVGSNNFSALLQNSTYFYSAGYYYGSEVITQGSNLLDKQLLPLTASTPDDTSSMIIANQIRFNVASGYWLFALYSGNKGWIDGAKYDNK
jgi:hypothetical protein